MTPATAQSSFLCTLTVDGLGLPYHVAVSRHPLAIRFTSFIGACRRSFAILGPDEIVADEATLSTEGLCRIAIGQVMRDILYDKAGQGDYVLDLATPAWDGALRVVAMGSNGRAVQHRRQGAIATGSQTA